MIDEETDKEAEVRVLTEVFGDEAPGEIVGGLKDSDLESGLNSEVETITDFSDVESRSSEDFIA